MNHCGQTQDVSKGKLGAILKCCFLKERQFFVQQNKAFQDKCVFLFYTEFQDGRQKWRKNNFFLKKCTHDNATALWAKNSTTIALTCTISEIFRIFHFHCYIEIQDSLQKWQKKLCFFLPFIIPLGQKNQPKSLYLARFLI